MSVRKERIYIVSVGDTEFLCRASTPAQAANAATKGRISVRVADTPMILALAARAGATLNILERPPQAPKPEPAPAPADGVKRGRGRPRRVPEAPAVSEASEVSEAPGQEAPAPLDEAA